MELLRSGAGTPEAIAAGTEIVLGPGDALLSRMEDPFDASNAGSTPVVLLDGVLFSGDPGMDPVPAESSRRLVWQYIDQDVMFGPLPIPSAPVSLRVAQATLEPGGVRPPPPDALLQLAAALKAGCPGDHGESLQRGAIRGEQSRAGADHGLRLNPGAGVKRRRRPHRGT